MEAQPTSARTCGPCSFCCKVMGVDELSKPAGRWCPHTGPGKGCDIYGRRPAACRAFACQWLLEPALPRRFRPDQCKVVLTVDGPETHPRLVANCDPSNALAWRREPIYGLLKQQARNGWGALTVVAKAGLRMWVVAPHEDVDLGDVDPRSPVDVEQYADGRAVVRVLPPPGAVENAVAVGSPKPADFVADGDRGRATLDATAETPSIRS